MAVKKRVAVISGTLHAAEATTKYLQQNAPQYKVINYLDEHLLKKYAVDGHITDVTMNRVLRMIEMGCGDGADVVLLTCTVFSAYQSVFYSLFKAPVFCAQSAMLEELSRARGSKCLLLTQDEAFEATKIMYSGICRQNNVPEKVDIYPMPDPRSDGYEYTVSEWRRQALKKIQELDKEYDYIGLPQTTATEILQGYVPRRAKIFSTPECALRALNKKMSEADV